MKIRILPMAFAGLAASAAGALLLTASSVAADPVSSTVLRVQPDACVCSRGVNLGERAADSTLYNCQCGPLQCVVHAQSGQLQCR